jgi:uncharacterized protein YbjT (DUF2867 family)
LPTPPPGPPPRPAASLSRLQWVEFDLTEPDSLAPAIGNAGKVVCSVGASESGIDLAAPKRIDGDGTAALVDAAAAAGVGQFILVSSIGTGKFGLPAGVLNLFGGVLLFKRQAEQALERSGMAYTIVRPGARAGAGAGAGRARQAAAAQTVPRPHATPGRASHTRRHAAPRAEPLTRRAPPPPAFGPAPPQAAWSAPPTPTSARTAWC